MKKIAMVSYIFFYFIIFAGCSHSGSPPEKDAKECLLNGESKWHVYDKTKTTDDFGTTWSDLANSGSIRVVGFKKLDGQELDVYGIKIYIMDYELIIEQLNKPNNDFAYIYINRNEYPIEAGKKYRITGKMNFEKSERGWNCQGQDWNFRDERPL